MNRCRDTKPEPEGYGNAISAELEQKMPDIEDFPVPEPQEANEIDGALFDSSRGYLEQLEAYRGWRNGGHW